MVKQTALISKGIVDNSLMYHLTTAKKNGVTRTEMAEILTIWHSMQAGRMPGQRSVWQRKCMWRKLKPVQRNTADFSEWASRM